jgi:RNA polymerase sigma-32 factor
LADEPITLEELADEFGVSRERVRQIEVRAFDKVKKAVKDHIAETNAIPVARPLSNGSPPSSSGGGDQINH